MKKISLFIILALSMVVFTCYKEEIPEPQPKPEPPLITCVTVEGRITNYDTGEPIEGELYIGQFFGKSQIFTTENGEFSGKFKSHYCSGIQLWFIHIISPSYFQIESIYINGEKLESIFMPWFKLIPGHHILDIQIKHKL